MNEIEVHISLDGETCRVGTLLRQAARGRESVTFQSHEDWLAHPARFSLEPGLGVGKGMFHPGESREMFGSIGDSAPDTWGRFGSNGLTMTLSRNLPAKACPALSSLDDCLPAPSASSGTRRPMRTCR